MSEELKVKMLLVKIRIILVTFHSVCYVSAWWGGWLLVSLSKEMKKRQKAVLNEGEGWSHQTHDQAWQQDSEATGTTLKWSGKTPSFTMGCWEGKPFYLAAGRRLWKCKGYQPIIKGLQKTPWVLFVRGSTRVLRAREKTLLHKRSLKNNTLFKKI